MDERKIQKDYVMNYLCRHEDEGGLGYRYVAPNVVHVHTLGVGRVHQ